MAVKELQTECCLETINPTTQLIDCSVSQPTYQQWQRISSMARHITNSGSLFNPVVWRHGSEWHWKLCSGGSHLCCWKPPWSIILSWWKRKWQQGERCWHKQGIHLTRLIIILYFVQKEGGCEFSCSTDLFLVWCHPHWCSPVWFSLWQTGYTSLALSIQPGGECSVMHVALPRLPLRQRHTGR